MAASEVDPTTKLSVHDEAMLERFEPRPTDFLITSAPKTGTTWLMQILHQIRSGGDVGFDSIFDVVPWLEANLSGESLDARCARFESLPDPRIFKTHLTREQTPGVGVVKIVLSSRDPRDVCVSSFHHMSNLTDESRERFDFGPRKAFDEHFESWMGFSAWFRNIQSWWPLKDDSKLFWVRYEDMKHDLPAAIDRIATFMGVDLDAEARTRAIEHSSFAWMKREGHRFDRAGKTAEFKPDTFIRKGTIGDYSTLLSEAQGAQILERVRGELDPDCVKFLGLGAD